VQKGTKLTMFVPKAQLEDEEDADLIAKLEASVRQAGEDQAA
jgi:hypothetical protein